MLVTPKVADGGSQMLHYLKALTLRVMTVCELTWESAGIKRYALHNAKNYFLDKNYKFNQYNICKFIHETKKYIVHVINMRFSPFTQKNPIFITITKRLKIYKSRDGLFLSFTIFVSQF